MPKRKLMTLEEWHAKHGYLVVSSAVPTSIGEIFPGFHHIENGTDREIPLQIIAETDIAEFRKQILEVYGREPSGNPEGFRMWRARAVD